MSLRSSRVPSGWAAPNLREAHEQRGYQVLDGPIVDRIWPMLMALAGIGTGLTEWRAYHVPMGSHQAQPTEPLRRRALRRCPDFQGWLLWEGRKGQRGRVPKEVRFKWSSSLNGTASNMVGGNGCPCKCCPSNSHQFKFAPTCFLHTMFRVLAPKQGLPKWQTLIWLSLIILLEKRCLLEAGTSPARWMGSFHYPDLIRS